MIGWLGLGLLISAYLLLVSKYSYWFIPMDILASFVLTIHAITLGDIPFSVVNAFVTPAFL